MKEEYPDGLGHSVSVPSADLPPELIAQLSVMPEVAPEDFTCRICGQQASNKFNYSPRDYERPPICRHCEFISGYSWNGGATHRSKLSGGSFRDRREANRIAAVADAIAHEATRQKWSAKNGRP